MCRVASRPHSSKSAPPVRSAAIADLTLAIEIANPSSSTDGGGEVALRIGESTHIEPVAPASHERDDLMPAIDRLFARAGAKPRDLSLVAVSVGPGGFTSTRVACATGKMIAMAAKCPCAAVPSALVAYAALERDRAARLRGPVVVSLASKKDTAWVCALRSGTTGDELARRAASGAPLTADGILALAPVLVLADRHLAPSIYRELTTANISIEPPRFTATACLHAAALCPPIDPMLLVPIYPREPEAVTLWRAREAK